MRAPVTSFLYGFLREHDNEYIFVNGDVDDDDIIVDINKHKRINVIMVLINKIIN